MFVVTVLYPATEGAGFDFDYYAKTHLKLVQDRWGPMGLKSLTGVRGIGTPDRSPPPYVAMATLVWDSPEAFRAAAKAHGAEIFGDIPNYTPIAAITQFSETLD